MSQEPPPSPTRAGPSRRAVVAAAALVGVLAVGTVVASRLLMSGQDMSGQGTAAAPVTRTGPVGLVPVDAPSAGSPECTSLVAALADPLPNGDTAFPRLPVADPAPVAAVAWGDRVGDPVVLRCGLSKPPELTPTSALREVSGVRWLPIEGAGSATWFAVDRPVYVAITLPLGLGTGPLQTVSEIVGRTLPARTVTP